MKRLLLLLAFCIATGVSYAQIRPNNTYIGGTAGGNIQSTNGGYKTSSINFNPAIGYFLNENWMAGLSAELKFSNTESYINSQQRPIYYNNRSRAVSLGPIVRYYHSIGTNFSIFGEGTTGFTAVKNKQETEMETYYDDPYSYHRGSNSSSKIKQLYAGFAPGLVFFPKPNLGIELKAKIISYTHGIGKGPNQDPILFTYDQNSEKNLIVNFSLASTSIGVGYYF